jgi:hypothetical protein
MQRDSTDGATDVIAALRLVRGVPFTVPVRGTRYAWAEPLRQDMVSTIVDTAAWLAEHHLAARHWAAADAAAQAGLRAARGAEQLWRLRFQALHRAGDPPRLLEAMAELDQFNEFHGLDLEPETAELLNRLMPTAVR